jgi:hypothetical protein
MLPCDTLEVETWPIRPNCHVDSRPVWARHGPDRASDSGEYGDRVRLLSKEAVTRGCYGNGLPVIDVGGALLEEACSAPGSKFGYSGSRAAARLVAMWRIS